MMMNYNDSGSFQKFYVNVCGWDMFGLPEAAGGQKKGSETSSLLIATGPSYGTWEGLNPGHMNVMAYHSNGELTGKMPEENDNWMVSLNIYDPSGNILSLGKCPGSRTWEEPRFVVEVDNIEDALHSHMGRTGKPESVIQGAVTDIIMQQYIKSRSSRILYLSRKTCFLSFISFVLIYCRA